MFLFAKDSGLDARRKRQRVESPKLVADVCEKQNDKYRNMKEDDYHMMNTEDSLNKSISSNSFSETKRNSGNDDFNSEDQEKQVITFNQECGVHRCVEKNCILNWAIQACFIIREEVSSQNLYLSTINPSNIATELLIGISNRIMKLLEWFGVDLDVDSEESYSSDFLLSLLQSIGDAYCQQCSIYPSVNRFSIRSHPPALLKWKHSRKSDENWRNLEFVEWIMTASVSELRRVKQNGLLKGVMLDDTQESTLDRDALFVMGIFIFVSDIWQELWNRVRANIAEISNSVSLDFRKKTEYLSASKRMQNDLYNAFRVGQSMTLPDGIQTYRQTAKLPYDLVIGGRLAFERLRQLRQRVEQMVSNKYRTRCKGEDEDHDKGEVDVWSESYYSDSSTDGMNLSRSISASTGQEDAIQEKQNAEEASIPRPLTTASATVELSRGLNNFCSQQDTLNDNNSIANSDNIPGPTSIEVGIHQTRKLSSQRRQGGATYQSGIKGVLYHKRYDAWAAYWRFNFDHGSMSFRVKCFGFEGAKQMAILARDLALLTGKSPTREGVLAFSRKNLHATDGKLIWKRNNQMVATQPIPKRVEPLTISNANPDPSFSYSQQLPFQTETEKNNNFVDQTKRNLTDGVMIDKSISEDSSKTSTTYLKQFTTLSDAIVLKEFINTQSKSLFRLTSNSPSDSEVHSSSTEKVTSESLIQKEPFRTFQNKLQNFSEESNTSMKPLAETSIEAHLKCVCHPSVVDLQFILDNNLSQLCKQENVSGIPKETVLNDELNLGIYNPKLTSLDYSKLEEHDKDEIYENDEQNDPSKTYGRVIGVSYLRQFNLWKAAWCVDGKSKSKYFSVKKLGFEEARRQAIAFRKGKEKSGEVKKGKAKSRAPFVSTDDALLCNTPNILFHPHVRKAKHPNLSTSCHRDEIHFLQTLLENTHQNNNLFSNASSTPTLNLNTPNHEVMTPSGVSLPDDYSPQLNLANASFDISDVLTGVDFHTETNSWRCHWVSEGRRYQKYYSVEQYGYERGFRMALEFRQEKMRTSKTAADSPSLSQSSSSSTAKFDLSVPIRGVIYERNCNSWRCSWTCNGQRFRRSFSVAKLGYQEARRRAVECRLRAKGGGNIGSAEASILSITEDHHLATETKNLTSLVEISPHPGVTYEKCTQSWTCTWRHNNQRFRRTFSVKRLGFEEAKRRALELRLEKEQLGEAKRRSIHIYRPGPEEDTSSPMEGVSWCKTTGAWRTNFSFDGQCYGKSFSSTKYGFEVAKQKAIDFRLEKEEEKRSRSLFLNKEDSNSKHEND